LQSNPEEELTMDAAENKALMRDVFAELGRGNGVPFVDALADDIRWTIIGSTAWSRTWNGLASVQIELLDPLFAQFETGYRAEAVRLIAEDDYVVIESRGDVTTKMGKPYRNTYCYVCRLEGGKVRELTEYCDTELLTEALAPPVVRAAA
jgi:ketosteroid isomerase-like protein